MNTRRTTPDTTCPCGDARCEDFGRGYAAGRRDERARMVEVLSGVEFARTLLGAHLASPEAGTRLSLALYRQVIPLLQAEHVLWFTRWDAWPDVWMELGQHHPLRGLLVWDKGHPGMGDLAHWGLSYELIASAGAGSIVGGRDGSILRYNAPAPATRVHPTEKPVALLRYLMEKLQPASVIDPFMGSGATLVAARELGIPAVGIEIDADYCAKAAARFDQDHLFGEAV